jgi:hypothetical protein
MSLKGPAGFSYKMSLKGNIEMLGIDHQHGQFSLVREIRRLCRIGRPGNSDGEWIRQAHEGDTSMSMTKKHESATGRERGLSELVRQDRSAERFLNPATCFQSMAVVVRLRDAPMDALLRLRSHSSNVHVPDGHWSVIALDHNWILRCFRKIQRSPGWSRHSNIPLDCDTVVVQTKDSCILNLPAGFAKARSAEPDVE